MTALNVPTPRIACVIVSYNGAAWIEQCLQSLRESILKPLLIVVDNASSDPTVSIIRSSVDVTLIETGSNLGFGRANNLGIAHALQKGAEHVFILNQDAHVAPDTLTRLYEQACVNPKLGILCPLQLDANGEAIDSTFLRYYLTPFSAPLLDDAVLGRALQEHYPVEAVPAAAWLLTRPFLEQVGGFDPLFFMYCEDDDLCSRARHHGWEIAVVPAARFYHCRGFHPLAKREFTLKQFNRRRSRLRSSLVRQIKQPVGSFGKNTWHAIVEKSASGLSALIAHLDLLEGLATLAAILKVSCELPRIARHRRQCMRTGPHWLTLPLE